MRVSNSISCFKLLIFPLVTKIFVKSRPVTNSYFKYLQQNLNKKTRKTEVNLLFPGIFSIALSNKGVVALLTLIYFLVTRIGIGCNSPSNTKRYSYNCLPALNNHWAIRRRGFMSFISVPKTIFNFLFAFVPCNSSLKS